MHLYFRYAAITSITCLVALAGCGDDDAKGTTGGGLSGGTGGEGGGHPAGNFIRIHYRLQGDGDVASWGAHFWGAGATEPPWGSPQRFDKTDDFGAYTDVEVTATEDSSEAWLGLIPVQCGDDGNCKKDVETSVRYFDLEKNADNPGIAECWITQGQAVQKTRPTSTGPAYKISRVKDFIDIGDGSVRLMFHVAPGSTGTVRYGSAQDNLDQEVTWTATTDINSHGLILDNLTPGAKTYYQISTALTTSDGEMKDESEILDLTPISFSRVEDASDWATWGSSGFMYQLIVRTFADGGSPKPAGDPGQESGIDPTTKDGIGDLVGLTSKLPYLAELGVDSIWMTPVFAAKSYHGYDTTDFYDIDPAVGTRKDFEDMATAAHALGIKIIVDLVQNHVANVNPWFLAGVDRDHPDHAKYHDWFVWSDDYSNMYTDKHPWDANSVIWACKNYMCYHQIFGGAMPELNYHNPEVRAEMKKISSFWIDLGADGFRLDASKHIDQFDENNEIELTEHGTHIWWKEFNFYVKEEVVRPPGSATVLLTGENRWDDPGDYGKMVPYAGEMDSQFDFPFRSVVSNFINGQTGANVDFIAYLKTLKQAAASVPNGGNPNHYFQRFLSNHDLERPATQFEGVAGAELEAVLKQAATIVLTVPGMPVIYYGEELGKKGKRAKMFEDESYDHDEFIREPMSWFEEMTFVGDHTTKWDIDFVATNAANVSLNLGAGICKAPNPDYPFIKFMADGEPNSWAAQKDDLGSLFNYYKKLIAIRRAHPILTALDSTLTTVRNTADVYEFTLSKGGETIAVVLNRMSTAQTLTRPTAVEDLITGTTATSFDVPPHGALILASP